MRHRAGWMAGAGILGLLLFLVPSPAARGEEEDTDSALVVFRGVTVPPVGRADAPRLIDAGVLETEGYKEVVLSIGGEIKEDARRAGAVGAILIPDGHIFEEVRRSERIYPFPLEVAANIGTDAGGIFLGEQVIGRIAFPRYRILLYNDTDRTATVSLFAYRTR